MKYTLKQQTNKAMPSAGQYVARVWHAQTIDSEQIEEEVQANCSLKASDVVAVLKELSYVLKSHLRDGDIVVLDDLGRLKLELECRPAPTPADFRVKEHVKGFRLHVIPESRQGRPRLYQGIKLEPWK